MGQPGEHQLRAKTIHTNDDPQAFWLQAFWQFRCVLRFAMRMLLLPKSMEEQFIRRVGLSSQWEFTKDLVVLMQEILFNLRQPPQDHRTGAHACHLVLSVCRDGGSYEDTERYAKGVVCHLRRLCFVIGLSADISHKMFSFMDDEECMMATLQSCDIFYMGGIFRICEKWARESQQGPARRLSEEIQRRVQYNKMAYIGICGGAKIAGSMTYYGLTPLNLLQGAEVLYDCNCSTAEVCARQDAVQITTGCGVAIFMWHGKSGAICFPVVKNARKWWSFAQESTIALQIFVLQKWNTPEHFTHMEGGLRKKWCFSLGGYWKYLEDEEWKAIHSDEEGGRVDDPCEARRALL